MLSKSKKVSLSVVAILGFILLLTYIPIVKSHVGGSYNYWLGLPKEVLPFAYLFIVLAGLGFLTFLYGYITTPRPQLGILKYKASVPVMLSIILLASIGWSLSIYRFAKAPSRSVGVCVCVSLIITAIASLLLLAGSAESLQANPFMYVGMVFFCIVVVLQDGIAWNARFIKTSIQPLS